MTSADRWTVDVFILPFEDLRALSSGFVKVGLLESKFFGCLAHGYVPAAMSLQRQSEASWGGIVNENARDRNRWAERRCKGLSQWHRCKPPRATDRNTMVPTIALSLGKSFRARSIETTRETARGHPLEPNATLLNWTLFGCARGD